MDKGETHYLTYDPDAIYTEVQLAYIKAGGSVLYPGDEKEMTLRAMMSVLVHAFAGVDNALRMATLRYALGKYLDLYGEKRLCYRMEAQKAKATVEVKLQATGRTGVIEAGTALTADGVHVYQLEEDITRTGHQQTIRAKIVANDAGSAGNGLLAGMQMQFLVPQEAVESVHCVVDASGGQEQERDEAYKERIRTFGLAPITTGTKAQYEALTRSVSSEILDARAVELAASEVGIYLILASNVGADAIIDSVKETLSKIDKRPMTDLVSVEVAAPAHYTLNVRYKAEIGSNLSAGLADVVTGYQMWQDLKIGRAFNPDKLVAELYQAGAGRVIFGEGSAFNGGPAEYTEIAENERCKGTITLEAIP